MHACERSSSLLYISYKADPAESQRAVLVKWALRLPKPTTLNNALHARNNHHLHKNHELRQPTKKRKTTDKGNKQQPTNITGTHVIGLQKKTKTFTTYIVHICAKRPRPENKKH